jgi:hypothetical protein
MTTQRALYYRVLVCGGRAYSNRNSVERQLLALFREHGPLAIIEGGSHGADYLARQYALRMAWPVLEMPAPWESLKRSAGPQRNKWMLDFGQPKLVLAFPGGAGTANMVSLARRAQVPVQEVLE